MTAWWRPDECLTTAVRPPHDRLMNNRLTSSWQLHDCTVYFGLNGRQQTTTDNVKYYKLIRLPTAVHSLKILLQKLCYHIVRCAILVWVTLFTKPWWPQKCVLSVASSVINANMIWMCVIVLWGCPKNRQNDRCTFKHSIFFKKIYTHYKILDI